VLLDPDNKIRQECINCAVELTWDADRLASDGHGLVDSWNEVSDAKNIGRHGEAATVNEDVLE